MQGVSASSLVSHDCRGAIETRSRSNPGRAQTACEAEKTLCQVFSEPTCASTEAGSFPQGVDAFETPRKDDSGPKGLQVLRLKCLFRTVGVTRLAREAQQSQSHPTKRESPQLDFSPPLTLVQSATRHARCHLRTSESRLAGIEAIGAISTIYKLNSNHINNNRINFKSAVSKHMAAFQYQLRELRCFDSSVATPCDRKATPAVDLSRKVRSVT